MNILKKCGFFILISCINLVKLQGQETASSRIVILPLHSNGIDSVYIQTAESILRTEIGKLSSMDIVSEKRTREILAGTRCTESECALEIGRQMNASQVLGCRLSALGEKIIAQYFLVSIPSNKEILIDQTTATTTEDLEMVIKRIAKSVVTLEPIEKTAEVGKVLVVESKESLRRATRKNFGIGFGYLYPQAGYENSERSFVVDGRFDYEFDDYAAGMLFGVRKGFAMNLYGSYLFTRTDLCPYVGGALGFHWVSHNDIFDVNIPTRTNLKSDGFELSTHAGMRVLHTYNFQMTFNLEYIYTFNDYDDRAIVFTIGIL